MEKQMRPLALVILDGWGLTTRQEGNAIDRADTPNMHQFLGEYPHTILACSGEDVGLPEGQMGNSEVGHLNIGAGRVVYQELSRISRSIKDESFFQNDVLLGAMAEVKQRGSALHLMGLLSDGGVHSHISHLLALLDMAKQQGLERVFVHAFLDGRDVPPSSAKSYMQALEAKMREINLGQVATVTGRFYAMDRDKRWERVEKAYAATVLAQGLTAPSAMEVIEAGYARGETDEFIQPTVVLNDQGQPRGQIKSNDAVIFFNFRPDRAREITRALVDDDFSGFNRPAGRPKISFTCMTVYDKTINAPVAFKPHHLSNTLGEVLAGAGLKQLRLAETEKYAHVTFFFNGGVEPPNAGEERILIPSPKVATYDLQPEMSAVEVTDTFIKEFAKYDVIIMNYANADMVGHTGVMEAAVKAVQTVDQCLGRVVSAMLERDGSVLITADHGNAEEMIAPGGGPHTAHTTDPVPFILVDNHYRAAKIHSGRLEDIAPTILKILHLDQPAEMTGAPLIEEVH